MGTQVLFGVRKPSESLIPPLHSILEQDPSVLDKTMSMIGGILSRTEIENLKDVFVLISTRGLL